MPLARPTAWLRLLGCLVALAALFSLAACGGGSGAPNNQFAPPPPPTPDLVVQPLSEVAYAGTATTITITSGVAPFSAFSNNATVLPVTQAVSGDTVLILANAVSADTTVGITIQDGLGRTVLVNVTVRPAPLLNALAFAPSGSTCGLNLCSGQAGTATVSALGPAGAPLPGRQIKFEVVSGPIAFISSNPGTPLVQTITVSTDNAGNAIALLQAQTDATTQPAQIRATDVTSGQAQLAKFTVVNSTSSGASPITVIPSTVNIQGVFVNTCSTGFRVDYYVFGGNPPYTISVPFPTTITLVNNVVPSSGGFFEVVTNGSCVNPLTFALVDSAGKQPATQPTLINSPGTAVPATAPPLLVTPSSASGTNCSGSNFTFAITGGTGPYNAFSSTPNATVSPSIIPSASGPGQVATFTVTTTFSNGNATITVIDSSVPQKSQTVSVACTSNTPPPQAMNVTPNFDYSAPGGTCVGKISGFVVTGGTPPYSISFPNPPNAGAAITPTTVNASGGGFNVTGLNDSTSNPNPNPQRITNITVADSASPPQVILRSITCP